MTDRVRVLIRWMADHPGQVVLFLAAALSSVWVALNVSVLGEIPPGHFSKDVRREIELDYAVGLLWWLVIAVGLWLLGGGDRNHLLVAWSAKFFIVFVAMLFYEYKYRYNLDAFGYLDAALTGRYHMYSDVNWFQESWVPTLTKTIETGDVSDKLVKTAGTENMVRIVLIISQITGPYYHALKVVYAFLGFVGACFAYRAVVVIMGRPFLPAFYGLMLYPSILFWSSILGKDPVFLLFIGLYAYGGALWLVRSSPLGLAWLTVALLGSFMLRPWMAAIEAGPLLFAMLVRFFGLRPIVLICVLVTPVLLLGSGFSETWKVIGVSVLLEELTTKVEGQASQTGTGADMNFAEGQALLESPFGILLIMFSGLFRPLPFDINSVLVAIAAIENTVLLVLTVAAFRYLRWTYLACPLLIWLLTYVLVWAGVYGLVVLANFGGGMRYKLQVLPFILLALFLLLHREGRAALDRMVSGTVSSAPVSSGGRALDSL